MSGRKVGLRAMAGAEKCEDCNKAPGLFLCRGRLRCRACALVQEFPDKTIVQMDSLTPTEGSAVRVGEMPRREKSYRTI